MKIPVSEYVDVRALSHSFDKATTTYKFYWFIAILELLPLTRRRRLSYLEIFARMISCAWYPIHYFRLSFGVYDQLKNICSFLAEHYDLSIDADKEKLYEELLQILEKDIEARKRVMILARYVPMRFLSSWFPKCSEKEIIELSHTCLETTIYTINNCDCYIEFLPHWEHYLTRNIGILLGYTYWSLTIFLQSRNPNVPDVPSKLNKPLDRSPLVKQRKYWDIVIEKTSCMRCIYTKKIVSIGAYDLDHFLPWSFVAHDQIWNLIPADKSINCSKSNKLPNLELFSTDMALAQYTAFKIVYQTQPHNKCLEDFFQLGVTLSEINEMTADAFVNIYKKTITPLHQIAENMGFGLWNM